MDGSYSLSGGSDLSLGSEPLIINKYSNQSGLPETEVKTGFHRWGPLEVVIDRLGSRSYSPLCCASGEFGKLEVKHISAHMAHIQVSFESV